MKRLNKIISLIVSFYALLTIGAAYGKSEKNKFNANNNSELSFVINNDADENSGELDFIKSQVAEDNLLTNSKVLFYGGILLISVSMIGIALTVIPRAKKKKIHTHKKENMTRYGNKNCSNKKRNKGGKSL